MRKSDLATDDEEKIGTLIERGRAGSVATSQDDPPFLHPNFHLHDPDSKYICFYTANPGRTRVDVETSYRIRACAPEMGDPTPADTTLEFSKACASLIENRGANERHLE